MSDEDVMTDPTAIEAALTDTVDARPTESEPEPEPEPATPVYNAVVEEVNGDLTDVWIDDLTPRQRTVHIGGGEFFHVSDAPDGRWIYRGRA